MTLLLGDMATSRLLTLWKIAPHPCAYRQKLVGLRVILIATIARKGHEIRRDGGQ